MRSRAESLIWSPEELLRLLAGHGLNGIEHTGDLAALAKLRELLDTPGPAPPIVTP